jgi:hypothetical protein
VLATLVGTAWWALSYRQWHEPSVLAARPAPDALIQAVLARTQSGLGIFASSCEHHVMLNDTPALPEGQVDFLYWDRSVLSAPCSARITPEWIERRHLRITLEMPRADAWHRVRWRNRDQRRNVELTFVVESH